VGRLLISRFGDGAIDIAAIEPEQVRNFFARWTGFTLELSRE
jgi:hypothetical protein